MSYYGFSQADYDEFEYDYEEDFAHEWWDEDEFEFEDEYDYYGEADTE